MKILIFENSIGFSSYTSKLCESFGNYPNLQIDYLTIPNNEYLINTKPNINVIPSLSSFNNSKKKTLSWLFDRIRVALHNIKIRNRYCKKTKYDVISIQETIPIFDRFFIKKFCKNNPNVVYTVHDVIPPIKSSFWSIKSLKKIYTCCHKLIVHTDGNKKQLVDKFNISPDKIYVINHGTDEEYTRLNQTECKTTIGLDKNKICVLFYGMIREQKGLDILIEALKGSENIQLFIAGALPHGDAFDQYDASIRNNNIDVFKMIRFIPEDMTDIVYNSCDFVCLPYKYFYSQSGVFMQAIKYRKPIVASDVSSFRDYFDRYNIGFLCKPNNIVDLSTKIKEMVNILNSNPNYFYHDLDRAARENSWDVSAEKYLSVFKK